MRLLFSLLLACALCACGNGDVGAPPHSDLGAAIDANGWDLGAAIDANGWDLGVGSDLGGSDGALLDDAAPPDDGAASTDATVTDAASDLGPVSMPCTAAGACDPFVVDSCGAGLSCRPNPSTGMTECLAIAVDAKAEGAVCTNGADCQPGLLCLNFGDGFTCNRMCPRGSLGFCAGEARCFGTIGEVCVQVCRPRPAPCDIYAQDCPRVGDACSLATDPETREPYTGCRVAGTAVHGDPCGGTAGACAGGLICIRESVDGGYASTCKQVCGPDAGAPMCTFSAEACTGFARTWGVAYCRVP